MKVCMLDLKGLSSTQYKFGFLTGNGNRHGSQNNKVLIRNINASKWAILKPNLSRRNILSHINMGLTGPPRPLDLHQPQGACGDTPEFRKFYELISPNSN